MSTSAFLAIIGGLGAAAPPSSASATPVLPSTRTTGYAPVPGAPTSRHRGARPARSLAGSHVSSTTTTRHAAKRSARPRLPTPSGRGDEPGRARDPATAAAPRGTDPRPRLRKQRRRSRRHPPCTPPNRPSPRRRRRNRTSRRPSRRRQRQCSFPATASAPAAALQRIEVPLNQLADYWVERHVRAMGCTASIVVGDAPDGPRGMGDVASSSDSNSAGVGFASRASCRASTRTRARAWPCPRRCCARSRPRPRSTARPAAASTQRSSTHSSAPATTVRSSCSPTEASATTSSSRPPRRASGAIEIDEDALDRVARPPASRSISAASGKGSRPTSSRAGSIDRGARSALVSIGGDLRACGDRTRRRVADSRRRPARRDAYRVLSRRSSTGGLVTSTTRIRDVAARRPHVPPSDRPGNRRLGALRHRRRRRDRARRLVGGRGGEGRSSSRAPTRDDRSRAPPTCARGSSSTTAPCSRDRVQPAGHVVRGPIVGNGRVGARDREHRAGSGALDAHRAAARRTGLDPRPAQVPRHAVARVRRAYTSRPSSPTTTCTSASPNCSCRCSRRGVRGAVAWGIAGLYLLVAIQLTSWFMRRLPRRLWHAIHLGSFPLFAFATVHGFTAGRRQHERCGSVGRTDVRSARPAAGRHSRARATAETHGDQYRSHVPSSGT